MTNTTPTNLAQLEKACVNTIRTLSIDAIQKANSGHPGAPMGLASAAYVLWTKFLRHNPQNPKWFNRDRFVLSGGHASMLLYSLLYLTGYDLSLDDIKNFRQWESKTPGHPEYGMTPGVETTTGPLGQGIANAVGMAMAECHMAAVYNQPGHDIVNHFTYVMCGDGDLMEGVSSEACSLAGHLGLGKLICIYDDNKICIEGPTDITFTEDVAKRFDAYGWQVLTVTDGNDLKAIASAIQAGKDDAARPTLIKLRTQIAYGSPNKQGSAAAHGSPLGEEEILLTKKNLECELSDPFCIPEAVLARYRECIESGKQQEADWLKQFDAYKNKSPESAAAFSAAIKGELPDHWDADIDAAIDPASPIATRAASGKVLNAIAAKVPFVIGGSADLAPSNNTLIKSSVDFQKTDYKGRNIRFGVREHAMGAILNGMSLHGGIKPFGGTFLVFADYLRPAIRLAALMKLPVIYVFTHDSIAVGEDGPTHQPVEHLAALRAIPNLTVIRPADAIDTANAWRYAVQNTAGPVALILSRQKLPVSNGVKAPLETDIAKGAYIVADCSGTPDLLLIATGSEVHIAVSAWEELSRKNLAVRVVNMVSMELFEQRDSAYREQILPEAVKNRIIVEAGIAMGWERYVEDGTVICMNRFGASAPGNVNLKKFGFTKDYIIEKALTLVGKK